MQKLYLKLYAISLLIIGLITALTFILKPSEAQLHQDFITCFLFYGILSPALFFFSLQGLKSNRHADFLKFFYGGFMIKLFLSLIFVMVYLAFSTKIKLHFIAAFGICYFVFSGIETFCLMNASKNTDKK